jgi:hypothetical protein
MWSIQLVRDIVLNKIAKIFDAKLYLTGGALCEHDSPDLDYLVDSPHNSEYALAEFLKLYKSGYIGGVTCTQDYNSQKDSPYHTIIKTVIEGKPVDFLFMNKDIYTTMNMYPLSIQMRCIEFGSEVVLYGERFSVFPVFIYQVGTKAEAKYRGYYPDLRFYP